MQVYKAFFKIISKNRMQIMIYILVFLTLAILFTATYNPPLSTDFSESKINLALINEDGNSVFLEGFTTYLSEHANLVNVANDTKSLQDALYFREVDYILRIPQGFSKSFLNGQSISLEKTIVPDSSSSVFMDLQIDQYLNIARTYIEYDQTISQTELVKALNYDLSQESEVTLITLNDSDLGDEKMGYFFNFMSYSLFAVLILGICSVMLVFNNPDLRKRNFISPMRSTKLNSQLILGSLSFAVTTWLLMTSVSFIFNAQFMFSVKGGLLLLNSFIFTLTALSISFLISNLVKSRGAMSAVANVFALGTSFISGVFVDQSLLGPSVLSIASFTPTYWYVKSNNAITTSLSLSGDTLSDLLLNMTLVFGFGIAILAITMVLIKQRKTES